MKRGLLFLLIAASACVAEPEFRKVGGELLNRGTFKYFKSKVVQIIGRDALMSDPDLDALIYVKNIPGADNRIDGEWVSYLATPVGKHEYQSVLGANKRVMAFDCGTAPKDSEVEPLLKRWREHEALTQARLNAERIAELEAKAKTEAAAREKFATQQRERLQKILAYQHAQASNGLPSFQLELGKRYLRGDGVESNRALALHWLQSAATNRESQAVKLLSEISR